MRDASEAAHAADGSATWEDGSAHGALLREARLLAGLSQRALALRMGVPSVTVRQAELGRDLRHATLRKFLAALPTLSARALLLAESHGAPPVSRSAWNAARDLTGFWSHRVSRAIVALQDGRRRETWSVLGLRSLRRSTSDPEVRRDLMMAACEGSGSALPLVLRAAGEPNPATLSFTESGLRHAFRLGRGPDAEGIDYRCARDLASDAGGPSALDPSDALRLGLFVKATHPTLRLGFRLRLPPGMRPASPCIVAWPEALLPGEIDLAAEHHGGPIALRSRRDGSDLAFEVEHPMPGTCYAACWDGLSDDGRRIAFNARPPSRTLAITLRKARESAQLSRRALASRMGAAEVVVRTAEQGRDVRRSTLRSYLGALSDLRPAELLRADEVAHPMTPDELERYWLDLFGCEALVEHKTMTVRDDGDCEIVHVVRGLRTLPGRSRALRLLDPQQPSYYAHDPPRCRRMDVPRGDAEGIRTRLHLRPDGRVIQEIVLPEPLAQQGAAFRREVVRSGVFHVTSERARALRGIASGPVQDGAMIYSLFPARTRILEVRFPKGYWPRRIVAHAWPTALPPYPEPHEVGRRLHPPGLKPSLSRAVSRVTLRIERPQVGFKYALLWDLP